MKLIIPAILLLGLAVLAMAVRILFIKGGKFRKSCSSVEGGGTSCECHDAAGEDETLCKNYPIHHPEG